MSTPTSIKSSTIQRYFFTFILLSYLQIRLLKRSFGGRRTSVPMIRRVRDCKRSSRDPARLILFVTRCVGNVGCWNPPSDHLRFVDGVLLRQDCRNSAIIAAKVRMVRTIQVCCPELWELPFAGIGLSYSTGGRKCRPPRSDRRKKLINCEKNLSRRKFEVVFQWDTSPQKCTPVFGHVTSILSRASATIQAESGSGLFEPLDRLL